MDVLIQGVQYLAEHWILTAIIFIVSSVYLHYEKTFTRLKKLGLKGPTPWPIIGNSFGMFTGEPMHQSFNELVKIYGKVCGFYYLQTPSVIVADPDILKSLLVKDFENFHDIPTTVMQLPGPFDNMLVSVTGQRWKNIRSILTPTFSSRKLKQMMFIMNEASDTLLAKLDKVADTQKAVDIHQWQQGVTMEVILSSSFGLKTDSQTNPDDKMTKLAKRAMDPSHWPEVAYMIPVIGKYLSKKLVNSESFGSGMTPLGNIAKTIIKQRKESADFGEKRKDVLNLMLETQNPENKGHQLTDNEIIAQMVLFMLAGYDTSSNVLGLTCYNLAVFPDTQDKVIEEINRVCSSSDSVTYDEIQKMPYLEACVSETLRLYPPGFALARTVTKSCTINGVPFEKGMAVFVPVYTLHRDPQYWPEPECFKPERFLPENKDSITQYTYLPFGDGPRGCIGMRFALMEIKSVLVRMLKKYRLVRGPETSVPIKMKVTEVLTPAEPVLVRVEKRET